MFNLFRDGWSSQPARVGRAWLLVLTFLGGLLLIEVNRQGLLSNLGFAQAVSTNHLAAIRWTVSVLLVFEIIRLVLVLERSVANALTGQLEVYSLILLRDAFIPLEALGEPLSLVGQRDVVLAMVADAVGAMLLFIIANLYSRLQRHTRITQDEASNERFVAIKKLVALGLLTFLTGLLVADVRQVVVSGHALRIFDIFFTAFVFVDVLLAIVSMGFSRTHPVVFRNFGFAFVAVLLRLALAAPEFARPALGVGAGLFATAVTLAYNYALTGTLLPERQGSSGDEASAEAVT